MKLFIWEDVGALTGSWHDGGGLAIIAADLESARQMIERRDCEALTTEPTFTCDVSASEPRMFVFPDAGCC